MLDIQHLPNEMWYYILKFLNYNDQLSLFKFNYLIINRKINLFNFDPKIYIVNDVIKTNYLIKLFKDNINCKLNIRKIMYNYSLVYNYVTNNRKSFINNEILEIKVLLNKYKSVNIKPLKSIFYYIDKRYSDEEYISTIQKLNYHKLNLVYCYLNTLINN